MDTQITVGLVLVGLAGMAAAVVGILLPAGERIAAVLPLLAGAGLGLVTLALGAHGATANDEFEAVFLAASGVGFVTAMMALVALWAAAHRRGTGPAPTTRDAP